jgi:hypothetical protein
MTIIVTTEDETANSSQQTIWRSLKSRLLVDEIRKLIATSSNSDRGINSDVSGDIQQV